MTATHARRSFRTPAPAASKRFVPPALTTPQGLTLAVLDFAIAAAALVLLSPVMLLAVLAVRLTSRGPAIYTQTRLGHRGRVFTLFKIRTMIVDAESLTGPRWCLPGDPRVTMIGRLLRHLHLDELPQLWNVLRGEMSLVGPRPERPEIAAKLRKLIPGYDRRLAVKPGLTGYAQVHLPPDETIASVRRKLKYDLYGIRQRSLAFHITILAWTALKIVGLSRMYKNKD